jgi:hypothetical protein
MSAAPASWWFKQLDGRRLVGNDWTAVALVHGVHIHGDEVWLQFGFARDRSSSVLLHVGPDATLDDVIVALEVAYEQDRATGHLIDVRHAA